MGYDGPNYTQTPNLFLDDHLPKMGCAETKVVLAVIRQTFGWHKQQDRISISQFESLTGLSRQGVVNGIEDALERGIIQRHSSGNGYVYSLVVNEVDHQGEGVVNDVDQGSQRSRPKVVNEVDPQKKGKETNQKKESAPAHEDPVDVLKELWGVHPTNYQKDRIRQVVDDVDTWQDVLDKLKMQNKDSKKAIGWAVEDYQDRPTGDGGPASKYYPSDDPDL